MEPSKEIKEAVENAKPLTDADARKWAELLTSIPTYYSGCTTIGSLDDILDTGSVSEFKKEGSFIFRLRFENEPHNEAGETTVVYFRAGNIAEVEGEAYVPGLTKHLADKNFFGFKGTWEEVVHKLVEISNFLVNLVPPFNPMQVVWETRAEELTDQDWIKVACLKDGNSKIARLLKSFLGFQVEQIPQPATEKHIENYLTEKFQKLEYPNKSSFTVSVKIMGYPIFKGSVKGPVGDSIIHFES